MRRTKKYRPNRLAVVMITLVVVILFGALSAQASRLREKETDYIAREAALQAQIEEEEEKSEALEQKRIYVQTKQYIEEVAKSKLGLVKPDEILLKPTE